MRKGQVTRQNILDGALAFASLVGIEGLTIGKLAEELGLSKSGLFAHFRSKETLQIQVLQNAAAQFTDEVVRPALQSARGLPRIQSLFERWLHWLKYNRESGGCIFFSAAAELDDKPGVVRDHLVRIMREWFTTRVKVVQTAVGEGHFKKDLDCEQFAHDMHSILLGYHYAARLLKDPKAEVRCRAAFRALIAASEKISSNKLKK